ncbi:MAG TPA: hypothetical protein VN754_07210, partial [Candidatus Binataceae bacterium]|nr:hypothetical protein [Candidatus Binataceae bacterium]
SPFSGISRATTISLLHISFAVLLIFGIALAFGIVGEIIWESDKDKALNPWERPRPFSPKKAYKVASIAVLIGVLGELAGDAGVYFFSEHLQTIDESTIAQLEDDAVRMLQALRPRHLNQNAVGENERLLNSLKKPEFVGMPVFIQVISDTKAQRLAAEMVTLFQNSEMKVEVIDQKRTGVPDIMISEGVTIQTHLSQKPEKAPFSFAIVPSLPTGTPEEKAWLAARMFTAAFVSWDVLTTPSDMPDFEVSPLKCCPNRSSLLVQVGPRPTFRIEQMFDIERLHGHVNPEVPEMILKKP